MTGRPSGSEPLTLPAAEARSAAAHPGGLGELLGPSGSVLLEGAGVTSAPGLSELADALGLVPLEQLEPFTPRRDLGAGVWSEPVWPNTSPMCMHHELGWQQNPPPYLVVACLRAPATGGRTGVADGRAALRALPSALAGRADRAGWTLVRRYTAGVIGTTWPDAFPDLDVAGVERYAAQESVALDWGPDLLVTRRTRPALRPTGPDGALAWSNLLAFLSEWTLDPAVRSYLVSVLGPESLPFETSFGDGEPFTAVDVEAVNAAYDAVCAHVTWRAGDVLVLDNVRTAHSMEAFGGQRAMAVMHAASSPENPSGPHLDRVR